MKTVGAVLATMSTDYDIGRIRINGRYLRKVPRSIKRLHVIQVYDDYYYDEDYGESLKIVDILTTKGR